MEFVIFGLGKSGTTALFYKLKTSLPPGTIALFEPSVFGPRERLVERLRALRRGQLAPPVLAKVLPFGPKPVRIADFERFRRQVLVVRDPRDRLVSDLLYRGYNAAFAGIDAAAHEFLDLVRRKEAEPRSVPVVSLLEAFDRLEARAGAPSSWRDRHGERGVVLPLRFHEQRPGLPVFRYERLVEGRFEALEAILDLPLPGSATVPEPLRRVVRSKGSGAWRTWFTPADVEALGPVLQPYLDRYYPGADWDLAPSPGLDPAAGSRYALSVINERRALEGLPALQDRR